MTADKKNSLWLAIQYLASIIFTFVTLKLNLMHFGNELFGMWLIFASLWGIGSVVDLGFGTAIMKYVAMAHKNDDKEKINRLISTGFVIYCTIGILMVIIGNVIGELFYFSNSNIVPVKYYTLGRVIFTILGINYLFQYLSIFFRSVFEGVSNFVASSKLVLIYNILIFISVILVVVFNFSLEILSIFYLFSSLLLVVLNFAFLKYKYPFMRISFLHIDLSLVKGIIKFSFSVQLAAVFGVAIDPVIKYLIGNYSSIGVIPAYEIARKFATAISGLFFSTFKTLFPKASIIKNKEEYRVFYETEGYKSNKLGILYSGVTFGLFSICIAVLIKLWFGFEESILIFLILCLPESISNFGYTNYIFIMGIGKSSFLALMQFFVIVITIVSVICGFLLFKNDLGLIGYFISVLLVNIFMVLFVKRQVGFSLKEYFARTSIIKLIILDVLILGVILVIINNMMSLYLPLIFLSISSILIFYTGILSTAVPIIKKIARIRN